ncbi:hypothetical protein [Kribbella deserti]|uniref:ABC transporter ATP-binding protein n=1 Tax=Kribbella deserti TaxID=1926257 RepID=A0ABV6QVX5_9ACTN
MQLSAHAISVKGPHAPMLAPTSIAVSGHQLVLLAGDPGASHTAASLGLSGRLRVDGGGVTLDGKADMAALRRRVAVVDTPGITEPDDALPVRTVIGEELAIAGRKAGRRAVQAWLEENDASEFGEMRFEHLPVDARTRLLAELTVARPDVQVVILTLPDRLGGDPHHWYGVGRDLAARGYGVVITCSESSARLLDVPAARLGSLEPPPPVQVPPVVKPVETTETTEAVAAEEEAAEAEAAEAEAEAAEAEAPEAEVAEAGDDPSRKDMLIPPPPSPKPAAAPTEAETDTQDEPEAEPGTASADEAADEVSEEQDKKSDAGTSGAKEQA